MPREILALALSVLPFFVLLSSPAVAAGGGAVVTDPGAANGRHFDPKGKQPSKYTIDAQRGLRATLPFDDKRDFEEASRGFIAAPSYRRIMADASNVAWDMASYD